MSDPDLVAELAALRERFLRNASARLDELARFLDAVQQDASNTAAVDRVIHVAHNLAGLGGTYGFPRVSEIARKVVTEAREANGSSEAIAAFVASWREAHSSLAQELRTQPEPPPPAPLPHVEKLIVLCAMRDRGVAGSIASSLAQSVELVYTPSAEEAEAKLRDALPDVLVVEMQLGGGELVQHLRSIAGGEDVLAIVVGVGGDAIRKVDVLRSGADSLLAEATASTIVRRLHVLLERKRADTPRILSVEDDPDQAEYLATVLSSAGYIVRVCDDPAMFEADLKSFKPDLILMDVDLPGVRGDELARSVRQSDELATLPIVFLTANEQPITRLRTARSGGDDFLMKPVTPALLLATVAARVERARHLKALFERDGVTGLLTHAVFRERLAMLWRERAVLVLIDLDHFKRVNDRFGHLVGDRVLASFGSLARQRLRALDLIGRYGGEEFALVVTDVNSADAAALTDRLRDEFAAIEHHSADGTPFHATFSAGVAALSDAFRSIEDWIAAADAALYRAKEKGRNRVELA